jgi:hypothetical protein
MKRIRYNVAATLAMAALTFAVVPAFATPAVNGANFHLRVFNDCPGSTLAAVNGYPASICINDQNVDCFGFANMHVWSFSADGGATPADFANEDKYVFSADMIIAGTGQGEAGLRISPWWSPEVDGLFNVRTTDGEIAVFGGRLPFYSFSAAPHLLRYHKGDLIHLEMNYSPNGTSQASPAQIEYKLVYNGVFYTSGLLNFDEGNPAEGHGSWGALTPARAGGHMKAFLSQGDPAAAQLEVCWRDIQFGLEKPTPTAPTSWGKIKAQYH